MSLAQVKDQDVALRLLRNLLERNRVPHGMLFWGPSGVGKRMAAMEFAKALLCKQGGVDACDKCIACRKLAHGNHPDVKIIAPTGKTRLIRKEVIEDLVELAGLRPLEGDRRVTIIQ
ncbi:MAG: DNA polymerase III subunit delta', partial [Candidatus Hydrogenedentes bacterium]|nr:DNA polymerase III subunit delta' [Candidatus Hydrogenedentota bacterium]